MIQLLCIVLVAATQPVLNVRVDGDGYLRFAHKGHVVYARQATLTPRNGVLATSAGDPVVPRIEVPANAARLDVDLSGNVSASSGGSLGRMVLALFSSKPSFTQEDGYLSTAAKAQLSDPGDGLAGVIRRSQASAQPRVARASAPTKGTDELLASGKKLSVYVSAHTELDKDTFTIGDVAKLNGKSDLTDRISLIEIGQSPSFGKSLSLSKGYVMGSIMSAGLKLNEFVLIVPSGAEVTRKSQLLKGQDIVDKAKLTAREQLGTEIAFEPAADVADMTLPTGDIDIAIRLGQKTVGGIPISASIRCGNQNVGSRNFTLVPSQKQAVVQIGDHVTIKFVRAGAVVTIPGVAKTAAWLGESITVVSDTGTVHTGTVAANSTVEVKL